jgi:hypothetical protein
MYILDSRTYCSNCPERDGEPIKPQEDQVSKNDQNGVVLDEQGKFRSKSFSLASKRGER